ncbi:MAG TPA: type III pantothenate kinase [bacterium]|nr:type III pantothenate kinase [bacterium]HPN30574.1 type III pantothenate kinase [bacterium]
MFCVNIGNTNAGIAVIQNTVNRCSEFEKRIINSFADNIVFETKFRIKNEINEESFQNLKNALIKKKISNRDINECAVSSVVPEINRRVAGLFKKYFGIKPFVITYDRKLKLKQKIKIKHPETIGTDRIANVECCLEKYGTDGNLIIVDSGTAATIDVVKQGDFTGGVITPGVYLLRDSLAESCSKLYKIQINNPPGKIAGKETKECLESGVIHGYGSMIEGLIKKIIKEEKFKNYRIICAGGSADLLNKLVNLKIITDKNITYKGIEIIYENNKKNI